MGITIPPIMITERRVMEGYKIYKVENIENGKIYIGATTKNIDERKADHVQKSKTGNGSYFQEAIGTYGPEAFSWEQIDTAKDIEELAMKEKYYIAEYHSKENGYNRDIGGGFKKTIYQYDYSGCLISMWPSLWWAALSVVGRKKSISNACLGYSKTYKGFCWSYKLNETDVILKDSRRKEVKQLDLIGNLIDIYESVAEASKQSGISKTCISRCCRGEREHSGGFIWRYREPLKIMDDLNAA